MNDEIKEIKIITLGDIFKNIETEDKAFMFLKYIKGLQNHLTNLQKENEMLKEQSKKDNHILGCNFASKDKYKQRYKDYKSRCENAYEELTYMSSSDYVEDYDIKQNCWIKLSNILQNGSEK